MHKAVRNVTRLFERIQDYEKRVVKRRGQLEPRRRRGAVAALVLLARALAPFAPHFAEGLLIASGVEDGADLLGAWPDGAEIPVAGSEAPAPRAVR